MPLAYTIYYVVLYGSIFLMLKQWYLNILGDNSQYNARAAEFSNTKLS